MKTTFSRTLFALASILLLALLAVGLSFQLLTRGYMREKTLDSLKKDASTISRIATAYYEKNVLSDQEFLLNFSVISQLSDADAVICNTQGALLLCSDSPLGCKHTGLVVSSDYLQLVLSQEYTVSSGTIPGLYEDARYVVSTPILGSNGQTLGIVMVSMPFTISQQVLSRLSNTYLLISLLVIFVAAFVTVLYARRQSSPLRDLERAAVAFGHGDLSARVALHEEHPREIRELSLAFNNMAVSLEKSESQRREFVANVSHELKTPMTTIGGYIDGILDGTIPKEQEEKYLRTVSQETKRLSRLVRSMLDISRLQEQGGVPEESKSRFEAAELVGQVLIAQEGRILEKDLQVEVSLPELPMYTFACRDHITQVLYNLVDNAIKFCPQGGELGLSVRAGGNKLYVTVENNGPTIPANELPLLFERFHKLDRSRSADREGWGLGLYIVKTIICSHGEDISVTSENGKTAFTFTLPLVN